MTVIMVGRFTKDEILRLAPDPGSANSGQELAQARKWVTLGGDDAAVWGECKGSGAKPYQVQIDLAEPAFKCSCPSRKFPCKHGLGLLLLSVSAPEAILAGERPAWVGAWLDSRRARAEKAAAKPAASDKPRDPQAAAKRRSDRVSKIRAGMADLRAWTEDLVAAGIASAPSKGFEFFDGQARRMVDAQAPGVARSIRRLGSSAAGGAGWQQRFLERLSLIHLLCVAVERADSLPPEDQADLDAALGLTVAAEELASLPATRDVWQVVGREIEIEDRLKTQRTWLFGQQTRRAALLLDFAHGAAPLDVSLTVGMSHDAELTFYPGHSLRASAPGTPQSSDRIARPVGFSSLAELLDGYSQALAACPWLERFAAPLLEVTPAGANDAGWNLLDAAGESLSMAVNDTALYTLLAISGGRPIDVVVEFDGVDLRPLTAVAEGQWIPLVSLREAA